MLCIPRFQQIHMYSIVISLETFTGVSFVPRLLESLSPSANWFWPRNWTKRMTLVACLLFQEEEEEAEAKAEAEEEAAKEEEKEEALKEQPTTYVDWYCL
ncbi:hypothetical protein M0804_011607 [Polistes exclamans]|nr:hypothetical protein M0804_011607 [Polistes exclamans]